MASIDRPGGVVRLSAGGSYMTVSKLDRDTASNPVVLCKWFIEGSAPKKALFALSAVEKVPSQRMSLAQSH
jgi:uncharacterized protein YodC (DUF2158 family)